MKRKGKKILFANQSVFSGKKNVLEWEGEALVGLPFDKYRVFPHCGHPFSRKLILKDQTYRRVTGMVRKIEKSCKTGV